MHRKRIRKPEGCKQSRSDDQIQCGPRPGKLRAKRHGLRYVLLDAYDGHYGLARRDRSKDEETDAESRVRLWVARQEVRK